MYSEKYKLISVDWKKIGKGALIAIVGALLTYITNTLPNVDLGQWTPVVMAFWSIVVNVAQKYFTGTAYIEEK